MNLDSPRRALGGLRDQDAGAVAPGGCRPDSMRRFVGLLYCFNSRASPARLFPL